MVGGGFDIFDGISVFGKNVHGIGTVLVSFSHGVTVLVLFFPTAFRYSALLQVR